MSPKRERGSSRGIYFCSEYLNNFNVPHFSVISCWGPSQLWNRATHIIGYDLHKYQGIIHHRWYTTSLRYCSAPKGSSSKAAAASTTFLVRYHIKHCCTTKTLIYSSSSTYTAAVRAVICRVQMTFLPCETTNRYGAITADSHVTIPTINMTHSPMARRLCSETTLSGLLWNVEHMMSKELKQDAS